MKAALFEIVIEEVEERRSCCTLKVHQVLYYINLLL